MAPGDKAWQRLGELLIAARVAKGYRRRTEFARALGLSHDRTLSDIENARRRNFDPSTIAFLEQAYGWVPGSIKTVLDGGDPKVVAGAVAATSSHPQPPSEGAVETVSADSEDADEMVFRLRVPPGATSQQRDMARRAAEASARAVLAELDDEE